MADDIYRINPSYYRVADVPASERPRELLDKYGAASVPAEVLLAVILRSGVRGSNVIEIAKELIRHYGSLTELAKADVDQLAAIRGMGKIKAQVLKSSFELARRLADEKSETMVSIQTPEDAVSFLREEARLLDKERFWVLFLDGKNRLKGRPRVISEGILNASLVHPREVFRGAITGSSAAVIIAHNHPSGDPAPSSEDIKLTRQLVDAGKILGIQVLDHIIVGRKGMRGEKGFLSMREEQIVSFA